MPGQDGFSLTKEIRNKVKVPIILLTAKGEVENRIKGLELGADDYLGKPFEPKELLLRIKNIINKNNKINLNKKHNIGEAQVDLNKMEISLKEKNKKINLSEKKSFDRNAFKSWHNIFTRRNKKNFWNRPSKIN